MVAEDSGPQNAMFQSMLCWGCCKASVTSEGQEPSLAAENEEILLKAQSLDQKTAAPGTPGLNVDSYSLPTLLDEHFVAPKAGDAAVHDLAAAADQLYQQQLEDKALLVQSPRKVEETPSQEETTAPPSARSVLTFTSAMPYASRDDEKASSAAASTSPSRSMATMGTAWSGAVPNHEFTCSIDRPAGTSLGLNLDALDGTLLIISAMKAGPVRSYNETVEDEEEALLPGDAIVSVNGERGSSQALLERLKLDTALELSIKRPKTFGIVIQRAYGPLGLQVEHAPNGTSLLVKMVNPGLIKDWNLSHRGTGIKRRDRVVSVNGLRGNPAELMANMKQAAVASDRLELEVCRY